MPLPPEIEQQIETAWNSFQVDPESGETSSRKQELLETLGVMYKDLGEANYMNAVAPFLEDIGMPDIAINSVGRQTDYTKLASTLQLIERGKEYRKHPDFDRRLMANVNETIYDELGSRALYMKSEKVVDNIVNYAIASSVQDGTEIETKIPEAIDALTEGIKRYQIDDNELITTNDYTPDQIEAVKKQKKKLQKSPAELGVTTSKKVAAIVERGNRLYAVDDNYNVVVRTDGQAVDLRPQPKVEKQDVITPTEVRDPIENKEYVPARDMYIADISDTSVRSRLQFISDAYARSGKVPKGGWKDIGLSFPDVPTYAYADGGEEALASELLGRRELAIENILYGLVKNEIKLKDTYGNDMSPMQTMVAVRQAVYNQYSTSLISIFRGQKTITIGNIDYMVADETEGAELEKIRGPAGIRPTR